MRLDYRLLEGFLRDWLGYPRVSARNPMAWLYSSLRGIAGLARCNPLGVIRPLHTENRDIEGTSGT
jgi:hypothetical protein